MNQILQFHARELSSSEIWSTINIAFGSQLKHHLTCYHVLMDWRSPDKRTWGEIDATSREIIDSKKKKIIECFTLCAKKTDLQEKKLWVLERKILDNVNDFYFFCCFIQVGNNFEWRWEMSNRNLFMKHILTSALV